MITRSLKGKLLVFGIFFIGIITGVLLTNLYETRVRGDSNIQRSRAERDVRNFHYYLGLSEEQREQVRQIMADAGIEFEKLAQETRPQYEAIHQQTRNRVRAVLTEEQQQKYDEYFQRRQQGRGGRSR